MPAPLLCKISVGGTPAKNLSWTRGDTVLIDLAFTQGGAPYDLTGATVKMVAKKDANDGDPGAVFSKSSALTGIAIVSAVGGTATVTINPNDTVSLSSNGTSLLFFDVQVTDSGGGVHTAASGSIIIYPDIAVAA